MTPLRRFSYVPVYNPESKEPYNPTAIFECECTEAHEADDMYVKATGNRHPRRPDIDNTIHTVVVRIR